MSRNGLPQGMLGVPDLAQLKRRSPIPRTDGEPGIVVSFTITPDGNISANIPPGLSLGAVGSMILVLQRVGMAILNGQGQ